MSNEVIIRRAVSEDFKFVFKLICELAEFEKCQERIIITEEQFQKDGCSNTPPFHCFVAVNKSVVVGYALFYNQYSTFEGRTMFLEDLYVTEKVRGLGIGKQLYEAVVKEACDTGCSRMDFIVLGWNKGALEFYKRNGAVDITERGDWNLLRVSKEALDKLAATL